MRRRTASASARECDGNLAPLEVAPLATGSGSSCGRVALGRARAGVGRVQRPPPADRAGPDQRRSRARRVRRADRCQHPGRTTSEQITLYKSVAWPCRTVPPPRWSAGRPRTRRRARDRALAVAEASASEPLRCPRPSAGCGAEYKLRVVRDADACTKAGEGRRVAAPRGAVSAVVDPLPGMWEARLNRGKDAP